MALETQLISLSLRGGLDSKSDRKAVVPGKLLEAENCVFSSPGRLSKRAGYEALPSPHKSGALPKAAGLLSRGDELLFADGQQLWAHSPEESRWLSRGGYVPMRVTQRRVVSDEYQQTNPDGARHAGTGLELFAWEDSRGGIWWTLLEGEQVLRPPAQLSADGAKCRVLVVGDVFAVLYQRAGVIRMRTLSADSPSGQLNPEQDLSAESGLEYKLDHIHERDLWDADTDGESLFIAYLSAQHGIAVRAWSGISLLELRQDAFNLDPYLAESLPPALTVVARPSSGPMVAYVTDTVTSVWGWNAELDTRGSVLMGRPAQSSPLHIVGAPSASSNIGAVLLLSDGMEWWLPVEGSAYVRLPIYDCQPAARPFIREGAVYVPTLHHRSDLQSTYFLWRIGATGPLAKWHAGVAGTARSHQAPLPSVMQGAKSISLVCGVKDRSETEAGGWVFGTESVSSVSLDFGADISSAELGGSLQLSGGCLQMYDGQRVVESGFHLYPEIIRTHRTGGGGKLSEGTYSWVAVYSWTDATGRIHRSAPSLPVRGEFEDGDSGTVTVQPLSITGKTAVTVELYRTLADGSMLYRQSPGVVVKAGEQLSGVIFDEGPSDEELQGNLPLYTQPLQLDAPQVLENHPPPPVGALAVHRSRLWVVDSTQPDQLWFSREVGPGAPPEFSDVAYMHVPAGPVTALGSLDNALVLFGATRIHGLVGQGPDATGQFSDYAEPQHISSDVGCTSSRSIATVAQGLVFQSAKGIYLLSRDFQVQPMPDIEGELKPGVRVQAAHLMQHSHQVRFVLSSGLVLVWDYLVGQWSVFTGLDATDAVVLDGKHVVARQSGQVWRETPGSYTDNGSPIRMRVATSWLQLADMAGFQRVRRAMLVGELASPHQLRLSIAYNYDPNASEHQTLSPVPSPGYGELYAFDEGQLYGGRYPLYAWRAHLKRQKCTAVQFVIEDLPEAAEAFGEGLNLSAIACEVGVKRGAYRRGAHATLRSQT